MCFGKPLVELGDFVGLFYFLGYSFGFYAVWEACEVCEAYLGGVVLENE